MSRVHCRCRHCETRRVLKQHPDEYLIVPQCRVCGKRSFRVDGWMNRRNTRAMGCMCSGYSWAGNMTGAMHRRGSKRCWFRADGTQRSYGDDDYFIDPDQKVMEYEHG